VLQARRTARRLVGALVRGIFEWMVDAAGSGDADPPDFTHFPTGERQWSEFIGRVAAAGDLVERHFIELKSEIDPTSKQGAAKIAKFILGAAHRDPERAAKYLDGHAVMILGVGEAGARGLTRFEAKDFVGAVQPYVGEPGPGWDFQRVRADDDRDVIVVTVVPPKAGDPIWPCCREGVGLIDGRIYIRADGETREANSGEIRALQARASAATTGPQPDLIVALSGSVRRFRCDASVLDDYLSRERQRLEACAPSPRSSDTKPPAKENPGSALGYPFASISSSLAESVSNLVAATTKPDSRTREQYLAEIDEWEQKVRKIWRRFASNFALTITPGTRIEVCSQSYLEEVKIKIRLDGAVSGLQRPDRPDIKDLPSLPRPWGPESILPSSLIDPADYPLHLPTTGRYPVPKLYSRYDRVELDNSNSVEMTVLVEELRPQDPYISGDELTLFVPVDHDGATIAGKWMVTAKNHHRQYSGELQVKIDEVTDVTEPLREFLRAPEREN
jgi:hypothetical protein